MQIPRSQLEAALASCVRELPDRELRVLLQTATRLVKGRRAYGDLVPKKRVWNREMIEEFLDVANYASMALVDLED